MEFYGYHGVFAAEAELGQRFYVDLTAYMPIATAAHSDNLHETVDYVALYECVRNIVEEQRYKLIETLAERIASEVLAQFNIIQKVRLKVTKPHPPAALHFAGVAVEIKRERETRDGTS